MQPWKCAHWIAWFLVKYIPSLKCFLICMHTFCIKLVLLLTFFFKAFVFKLCEIWYVGFFFFYQSGFCAEFDINAAVVQENYDADCKTHNPPCPKFYDSAEAYKCKATSYLYSYIHNTLNITCNSWCDYLMTHFCFSILIRIMQTIMPLKLCELYNSIIL